MATKKNYYYVGIATNNSMKLVTNINHATKTAYWNANEKPLAMPKHQAEDLASCLCLNFHLAVVVQTHFEHQEQYFCSKEEQK